MAKDTENRLSAATRRPACGRRTAPNGTVSGKARAMPRVRTVARQRRGRCLADTDLMIRSPLCQASIGVVASPSATSIKAATSGLSRSPGELRATVRTTFAAAAQDRRRIRSFGPPCKKHRFTPRAWASRQWRGASARTRSPRGCCHKPSEPRREPWLQPRLDRLAASAIGRQSS
jgi:hypothetical protein